MSLHTLATMGAQDPDIAWPVFKALWYELTATAQTAKTGGIEPFKPRPPMLITVDGLAHWMTNSKYRSVEFEPIHAHDLALVRHFVSLLSSTSASPALPNGGLILFSTSASNAPTLYSFDLAIQRLTARCTGVSVTSPDFPIPEPYGKLDERVLALFDKAEGVEIQQLKGLTKDEARGLMEYFALSGLLREKVSEDLVGEKWSLAGGGVISELEKLGRRLRALA
jgi:small subunit ribosomal protein S29